MVQDLTKVAPIEKVIEEALDKYCSRFGFGATIVEVHVCNQGAALPSYPVNGEVGLVEMRFVRHVQPHCAIAGRAFRQSVGTGAGA